MKGANSDFLGSARATRAGGGAIAIANLFGISARRRNQHATARALPRTEKDV
jgi:hypothetical protein